MAREVCRRNGNIPQYVAEHIVRAELADIIYEEDHWIDVLECIERRPEGWVDVRAAWQKAKTSGT